MGAAGLSDRPYSQHEGVMHFLRGPSAGSSRDLSIEVQDGATYLDGSVAKTAGYIGVTKREFFILICMRPP